MISGAIAMGAILSILRVAGLPLLGFAVGFIVAVVLQTMRYPIADSGTWKTAAVAGLALGLFGVAVLVSWDGVPAGVFLGKVVAISAVALALVAVLMGLDVIRVHDALTSGSAAGRATFAA
jgi:hypothetical protein